MLVVRLLRAREQAHLVERSFYIPALAQPAVVPWREYRITVVSTAYVILAPGMS